MKQGLLFLFFLLPILTFAQENYQSYLINAKVKQGSIMLGGNLGGSFYKVTDELTRPNERRITQNLNMYLRAKNGYFVLHDLAVGLDASVYHYRIWDKTDPEVNPKPIRETFLLAGPFVRYYLQKGFFTELVLAPGLNNFSNGNKYDIWEAVLGVGYSYFVNERLSLEPILSFRYFHEDNEGDVRTTMGPILGFGVQAYLLRRRAHVIKQTL